MLQCCSPVYVKHSSLTLKCLVALLVKLLLVKLVKLLLYAELKYICCLLQFTKVENHCTLLHFKNTIIVLFIYCFYTVKHQHIKQSLLYVQCNICIPFCVCRLRVFYDCTCFYLIALIFCVYFELY